MGRLVCLQCLEIKAANLGLFLPFTLRHFYWRDEGRQRGPTALASLLEVNDPVSSSWLSFRHFADIKPRASAKYILFPGARPMHLRLLCNATKRERWLGGARRAGRGERAVAARAGRRSRLAGKGDDSLNRAASRESHPSRGFLAGDEPDEGG